MNMIEIDGRLLRRMLIGAAETIRQHCSQINDLNVFPVPDGDTGTNMTKTIEGGIAEISALDSEKVSDVSCKFTHGALLGARGNSGVILSQIFSGIEEILSKCEVATVDDFVKAYKNGIVKAYNSVVNPTEGTILTVFREATDFAAANLDEGSGVDDFLRLHIEEAKRSLARTKELLPVLKEAGVVDSGGAGYVCIATGMYEALTGEVNSFDEYSFSGSSDGIAPAKVEIDAFTRDSVLEFGYCTEFLLRLQTSKCDPDKFGVDVVIGYLESIGGESIVAYKIDDVIKVHVHTFDPGLVLNEMRKYGEFLTVKIENMSLQHNETEKVVKERAPLAVLSVASGDGMAELFCSIGADGIVSGGQTNNPSAEEFIISFRDANADNIIVLPNNKNVYLAAKQAAELYEDARIYIIPTESMMQGFAALSVITHEADNIDSVVNSAQRAAKSVLGIEVTHAVRDAVIGGVEVKRGEYMALADHSIKATAKTAEDALLSALQNGVDMDEYEIVTLFVGKSVSEEERVGITERLNEEYPMHDIVIYNGGQEVYNYLVALE